MSQSEFIDTEGNIDPIDIVEQIAEHHAWEFDRISNDQIAMEVVGLWRTYSVTLAWSDYDNTLRLVCTCELGPTEKRLPKLYELLNLLNDSCWAGSFTWWEEQQLLVFRYGLLIADGQVPTPDQIDTIINTTVAAFEHYYPAVQLTLWDNKEPEEAMAITIGKTYGRA